MEQLTLVHSKSFPIERYRGVFEQNAIFPIEIGEISEAAADRTVGLSVLLVDDTLASNGRDAAVNHQRSIAVGIGLTRTPGWLRDDRIYLQLPGDPPDTVLLSAIRRAYQFLNEQVRNDELEWQLHQRNRELEDISKISIALSTVRDHHLLISMILSKSREMSRSDAGSLYLLDEDSEGNKILRWKLAQNDSLTVDFHERVLPITKKSLAGYVALTGETLVIDDAYQLPPEVEYSINRSFDLENGYLTKSILVFPMTNHIGDIIGVLQLINRRRVGAPPKLTSENIPENVIPFDEHTIKLMRSLAGQAAVAVENNLLYESIERLFEGFVTASVTAIEQRDPTTSGHSFRVADLTVELAKTVDGLDSGPLADIFFSIEQIREIRYASLLHDFGKVGVREKVLVKEKKLYPGELDVIRFRFDYISKAAEAAANRRKLDFLARNGLDGFQEFSEQVDRELDAELTRLESHYQFIVNANEPTVLPEGDFEHLRSLGEIDYIDHRGAPRRLLTPEEVRILSIRKGNLDASERNEIESHVTHTFHFLNKIPWTRDLRAVPDYAYAHHEKMNGRGYPRGLVAPQIPLQSRMMTVADIYDALTAKDRPYKKAVPTERALDILRMEVKDGLLDDIVVDIFIHAKVYERAGVVRTA